MGAGFSVSAQGAGQLQELSRALRAAGRGELRKKLRREIADAGRPVVAEVREAVLRLPVKGTRGGGGAARRGHAVGRTRTPRSAAAAAAREHGLRRSVAAATSLSITARGIRIVVSGAKLPPQQRSLPRHMDSPKGWRHPVFGRDVWVHEQAGPWFASTIGRRAPVFRTAVLKAMDAVSDELAR